MAITVQHGPIGLAIRLAQKAGQKEDFFRRFSAEQQLVQQAMQAQQIGNEQQGQQMQLAMHQQRLRQQALQDEREAALANMRIQAEAQHRGRAAELAERAEARQDRGLDLRERSTDLSEQRQQFYEENIGTIHGRGAAGVDPLRTPEFRAIEKMLDPYQKELDRLRKVRDDAARDAITSPAELQRHQNNIEKFYQQPVKIGGKKMTVGQAFQHKEDYLSQVTGPALAAQEASTHEMVAKESDRIVETVSKSLPDTATQRDIAFSVFRQMGGAPKSQQEKEIAQQIIDAIQAELLERSQEGLK